MRLSKIKLAGFKSFVDPTSIEFPSALTGVVGPNGCGKSNIIDAVRWVMGESSAKNLRGESLTDVIFNGSTSRKPVGQASIELVFDNSDGTVTGQYAQFNEISVKRQVSRDGQSLYFLNGTRCRRRDITDIFLGTGLGPRSYAIIEQGMISRLIEAKPEELRVFLEEAAGISKYKERRRETENRIRRTRENLDRLEDLREEVAKRLQTLQRQARTAERYKEMKQQERHDKGQLLLLKLRDLDAEGEIRQRAMRERETTLESHIADLRSIERRLESGRGEHTEASDELNEVQARYYELGAEIARLEQAIKHAQDMQARQQQDLEQAEQALGELTDHIALDRTELEDLEIFLAGHEPDMEAAVQAREAADEHRAACEEAMQRWQHEWDDFNQRFTEPSQSAQVERSRMEQLERNLNAHRTRLKRLEEERDRLDDSALVEEIARLEEEEETLSLRDGATQEELDLIRDDIGEWRENNQTASEALHQARDRLQQLRGRLTSLQTLQQAALGETSSEVAGWLEGQGLADAPRLAQQIEVEPGWERAVETVLGSHLEAVCVDGLDAVASVLEDLPSGSLSVYETTSPANGSTVDGTPLVDKVTARWDLAPLLHGIHAAEDLDQALRLRNGLQAGESVVTRDGIWLGTRWLRVIREEDGSAGILEREREIRSLEEDLERLEATVEEHEQRLAEGRERLHELEERREAIQGEASQLHRQLGDLRARLGGRRVRLEQLQARQRRIGEDMEEVAGEIEQDRLRLAEASASRAEAMALVERLMQERDELSERRERLQQELTEARAAARAARDEVHRHALEVESKRAARNSLVQNLERMQRQLEQLTERRDLLRDNLESGGEPLPGMQEELATLLSRHAEVEARLIEERRRVESIEEALRQYEEERIQAERRVEETRISLEQDRMARREIEVRAQALNEQLAEAGIPREELEADLPGDATVEQWQQNLEQLALRIQRLGPINLAAIDEYKEESERKQYLDAQHEDLVEALTTLENAIRKIDRETRSRFKETYDKVNATFQQTFPKLFGGGHAYLDLTGEDLLETGVTVMARPPGKRNSTIHLLSGGEKALTAVALVFSIFELNPAPFCMLDEVDAPLDDANVGRFCELVKEMSSRVQFIFITHNKTTMQMANQLSGVTMHEPGVSRLVAVDVDEAVQMAAM
jgi:chromosome segregation protein